MCEVFMFFFFSTGWFHSYNLQVTKGFNTEAGL